MFTKKNTNKPNSERDMVETQKQDANSREIIVIRERRYRQLLLVFWFCSGWEGGNGMTERAFSLKEYLLYLENCQRQANVKLLGLIREKIHI